MEEYLVEFEYVFISQCPNACPINSIVTFVKMCYTILVLMDNLEVLKVLHILILYDIVSCPAPHFRTACDEVFGCYLLGSAAHWGLRGVGLRNHVLSTDPVHYAGCSRKDCEKSLRIF